MSILENAFEEPKSGREVFCNRTLNMRAIRAIGYDMDYTLVHYAVDQWEKRAYEYLKQQLLDKGWPVESLEFDPSLVARGLVIDTEKGNLLKTNRFGFVKQATHGVKPMDFEDQRQMYTRAVIDLADRRYVFLNTLFSLSEGCIYAQLVDLLDQRKIHEVLGYADLYDRVKEVLETAHMEGQLKAEIIACPEKYVILDEQTPLTLLDQYYSGKKLMLITNSEWHYSQAMMTYAFDRFLPGDMKWRDLFDVVIVAARKPYFFTTESPFFEVVTEDGLLKPASKALRSGTAYLGGSAREVERYLGLSGDEILYVGDHMFGDVHVTKNVLRWRTALILRELENEVEASQAFRPSEEALVQLMKKKEGLEKTQCRIRLELQRRDNGWKGVHSVSDSALNDELQAIRIELDALDQEIMPLARAATELNHPFWGLLTHAGNDKSYLAYQMERYADIYTSRVSNLLYTTPFAYLRSPRGSMPHDRLD